LITLVEVLQRTTTFFEQKGIPSARLDAQLILGKVLGLDRVKLYLNFDRPMADPELETLRPLVRRRGEREPMAWVLGTKEFYGRDFDVGPGVLVPRPDTETLIEKLLAAFGSAEGSDPAPLYVADVGSGSGCIGITLALEDARVRVYAIDASPEALEYTRKNIEKHALKERVAALSGRDLAVPAARRIDWVVSNPPYIPSAAIAGLQPEVALREPKFALDGGADGLDMYRRLIPVAAQRAQVGIAFEVGEGQAEAVRDLLTAAGFPAQIHNDLSGIGRVVIGARGSSASGTLYAAP
jgi:release factor glutamine methyltransferase